MKIKSLSKFAAIILLLIFQNSSASELKVIKVGAFDSYPLIFQDSDGTIKGLYADLLAEIGKKENIRFEYTYGTWQDGLNRIKTGEVDMLTSVGFTEERSTYMDYCKTPLLTVWGELYTISSSEINGILEVKNKKIGVLKRDIFLKNFLELTNKFDIKCELVELESYEDVFKAVAEKKVDAGIVDVTFGVAKQRNYSLRSTGVVFNPLDIFFTTGKGKNHELRILLDSYLNRWKHQDSSVYSLAKQKWLYGSVGAVAVMPDWFSKLLVSIGIFIMLALIFIVLLKFQVKKATEKIEERESEIKIKNEELESTNEELNAAMEEMEAFNEELIAAGESLRESEEKFRNLVRDMQVGVLLQGPKAEIMMSNPKALELLGMSEDQLSGKTSLDPDWNVIHEDGSSFPGPTHPVPEAIASRQSVRNVVMGVYRPVSGDRVWLMVDAEPQLNDDGTVQQVVCTFIDITDLKLAEKEIQNLLGEKELLLHEVHHRIKNNMNTIKGLLSLQLSAEENQSAADSLRDAESRVQSMILLYDRLYCTENYRELPVKDYLQRLAEEIVGSFPNRGIVKVETDIDDFILNVQKLSPLGIIVNELFTNSMKYAFAGRDSGVITVSASMSNNRVKIAIQDNGVGIPETISINHSTGFGLDLVGMLMEQIGGSIQIERGEGTRFVLEFDV